LRAGAEEVLSDPEYMRYIPYALAGLLFGWTVEDVDKVGVYTLTKVLEVGLYLWKETNIVNIIGKALKGMGRGI
jgi:hypothetical protein